MLKVSAKGCAHRFFLQYNADKLKFDSVFCVTLKDVMTALSLYVSLYSV